jgi:hypothetical protein
VRTALYVAIVLALAALVALVPGGGTGAGVALWVAALAFWAVFAWFGARMYREHRASLFVLGDRMRAVLYGSIGVAVLTVTATQRLWSTPSGTVVWFALIAGASYGLYAVWRNSRAY